MACWTLVCALRLLAELDAANARALRTRLALDDDELQHWDDVSRRLYLPFDGDGVLSQFESYEALRPAPDEWLRDGRPRLDWMLEARDDSCDRYQLTKQADVLMLAHLFPPDELRALMGRLGYPVDEQAGRRTVDYHLARITHESSLSQVVCAGALAHLEPERSWAFFRQSLDVDLGSPSDSGTLEGIHLGAMAGTLDVLQRHYLGLQPTVDGLRVFPEPPPGLDDVELSLQYRGCWLDVTLRGEHVRLAARHGNACATVLVHDGGIARVEPGRWVALDARR
jgi:trehalose/maltose hydrolase-like predicted phosphorylase